MKRSVFKSKLHRVRVTDANLSYEGSVTIDSDLMTAADILPFEHVHVWNATNGSRLETYAIAGPPGSGVVCINGAAARLCQPGDVAIIATFADVDDAEARAWKPTVVLVDHNNKIVVADHTERPGPQKPLRVA